MNVNDWIDKYGTRLLTITVTKALANPDNEPVVQVLSEMLSDLRDALEQHVRERDQVSHGAGAGAWSGKGGPS